MWPRYTISATMPADTSQQPHFERTPLTGTNTKTILSGLGEWLEGAAFSDDGTLEQCKDPGINKACKPLLVELGLWEKVSGTELSRNRLLKMLQIQAKQNITYTVLRIRRGTVLFENPTRSADLIPIRVVKGNPTVSGHPLVPGWRTHIAEDVQVSAAIEFLAVVYQ